MAAGSVLVMSVGEVQHAVDAFFERPADQGCSLAVVVVHRGAVIAERYGVQPETLFEPARPVDADSTLISWSTAKSMTHAAVGVLVRDDDPESGVPGGLDYGRHWWMWGRYPGSLAAHGYDGQYVLVVPDRELVVAHLGKTPAEQRHHVVRLLTDLVDEVPVSADASIPGR